MQIKYGSALGVGNVLLSFYDGKQVMLQEDSLALTPLIRTHVHKHMS